MISRSSINYSDILIMERNLPVFADSVNYYFQEALLKKRREVQTMSFDVKTGWKLPASLCQNPLNPKHYNPLPLNRFTRSTVRSPTSKAGVRMGHSELTLQQAPAFRLGSRKVQFWQNPPNPWSSGKTPMLGIWKYSRSACTII